MLIGLGTLIPVIGLVLTLIGARRASGHRRWAILALGPASALILCALVADTVFRDANALAATLYILYAAFLALYYPLLAAAWILHRHLRQHAG